MKKFVCLALSLLLTLTALPSFAQEPVTLTYAMFSGSGDQEETLNQMIAVFEEKNPDIKIDLQLTGYNDYFTNLATKIGGGNAPDVFEMNMENFLAYMLRGACADLSGLGIQTENYFAFSGCFPISIVYIPIRISFKVAFMRLGSGFQCAGASIPRQPKQDMHGLPELRFTPVL